MRDATPALCVWIPLIAAQPHDDFGRECLAGRPPTRRYVAWRTMRIIITATAICSTSTAVFMVITFAK